MSSPIGVGMGRPANLFSTTGSGPAQQTASTAQAAATQAPVSLTLPPPPRSDVTAGQADRVRSVASEPVREGTTTSTPSRADAAKTKLMAAGDKLLQARQEGVDVAKTSFWKKALGVALSAVAVGVAVGLTAISFGGATPLLALACVNFAVSTGDAVCAYRNMRNMEAIADHRPPPYEKLPMGNSIVANVVHGVLTRGGISPETAATAAKWTGITVGVGLAVASVVVSAGMSGLPTAYDLAGKVASSVGTAVAVASTVGGLLTDDMDRELLQESLDEVRGNVMALKEPAGGRTELDPDGGLVASALIRSLDGKDTASATELHESALTDAGRTKDAVTGAVGVFKAVDPAIGVMSMVKGAIMG